MGESNSELGNLVRALDRLSLAIEQSSEKHNEWEVVGSPQGQASGSQQLSEEERRQSQIPFGDYDAFALLLPPVPTYLFRLGRRLVEGHYTAEYRIRRAFEAGYWASLVLANKLDKPRASLPLNIRPTVYVVLRAPGLQAPTRVANASDLHRVTGKFNEATLCHGFPSLAEAEAYCCGAKIELPCLHQWN